MKPMPAAIRFVAVLMFLLTSVASAQAPLETAIRKETKGPPAVTPKVSTKAKQPFLDQPALTKEATIQFVGLVLFTTRSVAADNARFTTGTSEPEAKEVVAIMPSVDQGNEMSVENHTSLIAFKPCDLRSVTGWEVKQLDPFFLYIELDGDSITFVADGVNETAKVDTKLHRVVGQQLLLPYTPPLYSGAAAVFTIPSGTLKACYSTTSDVDAKSRVDTKLTLKNKGTLTIKSGSNSLTVDGNAPLAAANVPLRWATVHDHTQVGSSHYSVYCAMTGDPTCKPPDGIVGLEDCNSGINVRITGTSVPIAAQSPLPSIVDVVDVFCSNTQWP